MVPPAWRDSQTPLHSAGKLDPIPGVCTGADLHPSEVTAEVYRWGSHNLGTAKG